MIINLYQQCVYKWQQRNKHFKEFYLQDGGENQLAYIWNEITSLSPYMDLPPSRSEAGLYGQDDLLLQRKRFIVL